MSLKVKMTTSANREGLAIANNSEQTYPTDEAVSLVVNGLATPVGWELVDGKPVTPEDESTKKSAKK